MSKNFEVNKKVGVEPLLKRQGHLFEQITDIENIKMAIWKSSTGKREQRRVKKVLEDVESHAYQIQEMLTSKTYKHSAYIHKTIQDQSNNKERNIYKPRYFPDQIIHWSLMLVLEPVIMKGMYQYSCGSIPKRGTSFGQRTVHKWMKSDRKHTKYCLKMDVKKFYPSIKNDLLKQLFRRKIKDKDCLWLVDEIIDSAEGLPIGNYTSQWFSNFFLQELDHFIKQKLQAKYYIRYVDDLVIFGNNKKKLHKIRIGIETFLKTINLDIKKDWQVFPTRKRAVDFLGIRFYQGYSTMRRRNALRIMRRMRKIKKKNKLTQKDASAIISYWGWIKSTSSYWFYHKHVKPIASISKVKRTVSNYAKLRNFRQRKIDRERNEKRWI